MSPADAIAHERLQGIACRFQLVCNRALKRKHDSWVYWGWITAGFAGCSEALRMTATLRAFDDVMR